MALKKDKQKVLGEFFDDARIKTFLIGEARDGVVLDYVLLERAYRGMKAENFATFLTFFNDASYNINAQNENGETLLQVIAGQRMAADYIDALQAAGAK